MDHKSNNKSCKLMKDIEREIRILSNIHSYLFVTCVVLISGLVAFIIGSQI